MVAEGKDGKGSKEFGREFKLYRAKKDGSGVAASFAMSAEKSAVFLEVARQAGPAEGDNATFNWKQATRFKLGINDLGEIMAVLEGRQPGIGAPDHNNRDGFKGLFHKTETSTTVLRVEKGRVAGGYYLQINQRKGSEQVDIRSLSFSLGEASLLLTLLRLAVARIYSW